MISAEKWFTTDQVNKTTFIISEYRHPEKTHCYLLCGTDKALLIDTGLGIYNIYNEVVRLTDKPVIAVATHVHWDHIGGHKYFPEFYAHKNELHWLKGHFPLPLDTIHKLLIQNCQLPNDYDPSLYKLFQGNPKKLLDDGDIINLGERNIQVLHTPGHSPGHMCFWDKKYDFLFTGDLVYMGTLHANYPSTNPLAYLKSIDKIADYAPKRIFPGHHSLNISTDIIKRIQNALQQLENKKLLCHGSGNFDYQDWSIIL